MTTAKLSPSGGADGQVLKSNGSAAVWGDDQLGGLTLSGDVVKINNTATSGGRAIYAGSAGTTIWARTTSSSGNSKGVAGTSAAGFGIYGGTTSGYAGYFDGRVNVNGTLTKSGGSFKIDHPLDPEHEYLYHSFVESPDMKNVYDGVIVTDETGSATVTLPDWFEALNRDFRYQLTVIGQFAQAIVEKEIEGNAFVIRTNQANVKVSWQVTGIRKDPWANAHRIPVEEEKPAEEQRTYLHAAEWGQPEELGLAYRERQALGAATPGAEEPQRERR